MLDIATIGCWIIAVLAIEEITETITAADAFGWLRRGFALRAYPVDEYNNPLPSSLIWKILAKVTTCGWCMSGWVSFAASWFLPGDYFGMLPNNNIFLKWFAVWKLANIVHDCWRRVSRGMIHAIDLELKTPVALQVGQVTDDKDHSCNS